MESNPKVKRDKSAVVTNIKSFIDKFRIGAPKNLNLGQSPS